MRVMSRAVAFLCAANVSLTPAVSAPRQPTGAWHVDYDTAQCVAMRNYGTETKPIILALKPSPNNGVMRILTIRSGSAEVDQMPALLRLGDFRKDTNLLTYSDEKNRFRIVAINMPMAEFNAHLAAPYLNIVGGG